MLFGWAPRYLLYMYKVLCSACEAHPASTELMLALITD